MEPTEENRRAWDELQRLRVEALTEEPGIPGPIREILPDLEGKHVLHLMCGTGEASGELAARGGLVTGVDVWEQALAVARERSPNVVFVQADPHHLPLQLRRRRFDLVFTGGGVLRYLSELDSWALGIASALRPGGRLILYDTHPALECLELTTLRWRESYFEGTIERAEHPGRPQAFRLWRLGEVVTAIACAGLTVLRLDEVPSLSPRRRHDPRVPGAFVLVADKR